MIISSFHFQRTERLYPVSKNISRFVPYISMGIGRGRFGPTWILKFDIFLLNF